MYYSNKLGPTFNNVLLHKKNKKEQWFEKMLMPTFEHQISHARRVLPSCRFNNEWDVISKCHPHRRQQIEQTVVYLTSILTCQKFLVYSKQEENKREQREALLRQHPAWSIRGVLVMIQKIWLKKGDSIPRPKNSFMCNFHWDKEKAYLHRGAQPHRLWYHGDIV